MRYARQLNRRPIEQRAEVRAVAAEPVHTGRWIALFLVLSSLLTYGELRSEMARLHQLSIADPHAGATRSVQVAPVYTGVMTAAAIRRDVD